MIIKNYLKKYASIVEKGLETYLPKDKAYPAIIHKAMRYSVFAGGKKIRPILVILGAEAVGGNYKKVLSTACAMELIHTYSLIHDDLPCMDDDDYRRGRLTSHKVFGEGIAVLAGDGLLTYAFELIGKNKEIKGVKPENVLKALDLISKGAGTAGMVGGQVVDVISENKEIDVPTLQYIHTHKTGALIRASILSGAALCNASKKEYFALLEYGEYLGLIFQIADDILNVTGDAKKLGKAVGSDAKRKKATFPSIFGLDESRKIMKGFCVKAKTAIKPIKYRKDILEELVDFTAERDS